ncbi:XdhC family protein [Rhodopirellula sp. JC639]|uniref:XdhC family protein n=1 Tax=Stieleria mannarensis TaxID=2755585 RepID=UPI0015FFE631|nr:XdhC family protein [Rhodopirellula sp. JC639]
MTYDVVQHHQKLTSLLQSETPFATVTLIDIRGSAPQITGAKAIVTTAGIESGTIGGGKIEAAAITHAQRLLTATEGTGCDFVVWNLQTDIGMTCGGEVKLFFEVHGKVDWPIAVFGAGHVAQVLVPMLCQLHCRVTCIDPRPNWLAKIPEHPKLTKRCVEHPNELVAEQSAGTFFVLISKGHATDLPVLAELLSTRDAPYIGVIGSPQKASVLKRELKQRNVPVEKLNSYFCPIGIPLGNNTPAEISISIVAQLIQQRDELGVLDHKVKRF